MGILVTGGAGYIGSHTAKALRADGQEPVVLDDLSMGHREAVRWSPFIEGDIADASLVRSVVRDYRIDAVVHFAANAYVGESMQDPAKYFRNNVTRTLRLLESLLESGVRRFVFSSSCATYGTPDRVPIAEEHPQRPTNPYGESKLIVERVLRWYGEIHGLQWVALRYFNAAGADPGGELGEDHDPEPHLIPLVIQAALGMRDRVDIFGTDYATPDGTAVRDYIHVADLASAHVAALKHKADAPGVAFNLGTGRGHSVRDVIRAVERITGRRVPVRETARRPGDPAVLVADASRATSLLGWAPRHSDLDTIVETAWRWHARAGTVERIAL